MRTKTVIATALTSLALIGGLAACSTTTASSSTSSPASSSSATQAGSSATLTGTFGGDNGEKVAGTVTISGDTVKLSGFSSDEGPDLHLYLANGTTENAVKAGTELGAVKFDAASQTFTLPAGVDASKFTDVLVHCDKALAVFGAAPIAS